MYSPFTFDVDVTIEKSYSFDLQECAEVFQPDLEGISVVKLQVHVNVEPKVSLDISAQWIQ